MRKNILKYFEAIDNWLYVILIFCFLGLVRNFLMLRYFEFNYSYFATKVCFAMFVIYFAQIALILMRQRIVFVISLIQLLFCAFVFRDFTFIQLNQIILSAKNYFFPEMNYAWSYFISFACFSLMFCLEIIKTYLLYTLTDQPPKKKLKRFV
jgi:hypothetical protein